MSITVLIVDDEPLARAGIRTIFDVDPGIEVIGEAIDGESALEETERCHPEVVVMDIRMPGMDGIEATRCLMRRTPNGTRVLILTTFEQDEHVYGALRAGASGFLLKDSPPETLISAVHIVAAGDALLSPSVTRRLILEFARTAPRTTADPPRLEELTPRELEVLEQVGHGLSNAEIAERLVVSQATVKTHVSHILLKLGLRDRVGAVVVAYESGLIQPGRTVDDPA